MVCPLSLLINGCGWSNTIGCNSSLRFFPPTACMVLFYSMFKILLIFIFWIMPAWCVFLFLNPMTCSLSVTFLAFFVIIKRGKQKNTPSKSFSPCRLGYCSTARLLSTNGLWRITKQQRRSLKPPKTSAARRGSKLGQRLPSTKPGVCLCVCVSWSWQRQTSRSPAHVERGILQRSKWPYWGGCVIWMSSDGLVCMDAASLSLTYLTG